jgi:HD-GYP domain-containing protein (c-di-GMP phosphodiesterase class II)
MNSSKTFDQVTLEFLTERNTALLLERILTTSREITNADAGSLFLVEEEGGDKHLVFKLTQNDSHSVPFSSFKMDIDTHSIVGYAAATGQILNIKDAYRIRNLPFQLNRDFDQKFGYRTKSMLIIPMKNQKDEVIGVLQLVNAKRHRESKVTSPEAVAKEIISFSQLHQEQVSSLTTHAAVALENNMLRRNIEDVFDGFAGASVTPIGSRDPATFGHSERVAKLTVALAEAVDRTDSGPYKDVHFNREDIREIQYASLLHDVGNFGVREEVLVKAKKLYPAQLELIKKRFQYIRNLIERESSRKKLDYLVRNGNQNFKDFFAEIDADQFRQFQTLGEFLNTIQQANDPTVLNEKPLERLVEIAGWTFQTPSGPTEPLLTQEELQLLSITKGSLTMEERMQIESHVIHSFRFLSQIPWTKDLRRVPEIATAHHEKLDGSGYPYHMKGDQIPFQSKMLAIADMFDALTDHRPWRRAFTVEEALDIMREEVKWELLDPGLFQLFVDSKVYQLTAKA